MKIGLVVERFDPHHGGAEFWTYQHAKALAARGHEIHIVTQMVDNAEPAEPFTYHVLGLQKSRLRRAEAADEALRRLDLDIIHDIGMGWTSDLLQSEDGSRIAQWEAKLSTLPPWARSWKRKLIRVLPKYSEFRALMQRQFSDPNRTILAVSQMCAEDYQRYHGVSPERIRVVYHGTDTERFSPDHRAKYRKRVRTRLRIDDEETVCLFVGHDFVRKGLRTAVEAIHRLIGFGHRARLLVVGERKKTRGIAGRRDGSAVLFTGRVADSVPYYSAADVFVLPTFYDPCSLSVGEALASGLPVITTRTNGASEMIQEGVHGHVMHDPADDIELAEHLYGLLDPVTRQTMSFNARQRALQFPLERNCNEILAIYEEIRRRRTIPRWSIRHDAGGAKPSRRAA